MLGLADERPVLNTSYCNSSSRQLLSEANVKTKFASACRWQHAQSHFQHFHSRVSAEEACGTAGKVML